MMEHLLIVIAGPSGVGKGTVVKELFARNTDDSLALSVSCTTRSPRKGEVHGKEYFFLSEDEFMEIVKEKGFLEYDLHFAGSYGTPKRFVEETLKTKDVVAEVDVNGALNIKKSYPQAVTIFLAPPSLEELRRRLVGRGSEKEDEVTRRLARVNYECSLVGQFDHVVVNDNVKKTVDEIEAIVQKAKNGQ